MVSEQLQDMLNRLKESRRLYCFELETAPAGKLLCARKANGPVSYYQSVVEDGKRVRHGITKQPDLVKDLARKEYVKKVIPLLDRNIEILERACGKYQPCQPQDLIADLMTEYGEVPEQFFFDPAIDLVNLSLDLTDEAKIKAHTAWGAQAYTASDYLPEGRTVITSRGERMRSKAEVMIAEKLYEYSIPFHYEQEVLVGDVTFHPDFTFEAADGGLFFLEFCGMMDDARYVESYHRKRALYEAAGIVPWKNIIYVYAQGNSLDMRQIESVIRTQVLAWL